MTSISSSASQPALRDTRPEIVVESKHDFQTTLNLLRQAVAQEGFGLQFEIDLASKLHEKGFASDPTVILGVCSAGHASAAMHDDPRIVAMLPCRIAVYEGGGKTKIATANARLLADMYEGPNLARVAREVSESLDRILAAAS